VTSGHRVTSHEAEESAAAAVMRYDHQVRPHQQQQQQHHGGVPHQLIQRQIASSSHEQAPPPAVTGYQPVTYGRYEMADARWMYPRTMPYMTAGPTTRDVVYTSPAYAMTPARRATVEYRAVNTTSSTGNTIGGAATAPSAIYSVDYPPLSFSHALPFHAAGGGGYGKHNY